MTLTFDPKIIRGHLLAKTNAPTKSDGKMPMGCQSYWSETVFTYNVNMTLLLTPKSLAVIYLSRPMHLRSLRANSPWVVNLLIGYRFYLQGQCDDFWLQNQ
jgi:hypothetical protein